MTRSRKAVLDILVSAQEPRSASDVFALMAGSADQATVYRTLHYLEENGFAESFILHCTSHGTERFYTVSSSGAGEKEMHRHWFHCEDCHRFTDLGNCTLDDLVQGYETRHGIEVKTHTLYLTGVCASCLSLSQVNG